MKRTIESDGAEPPKKVRKSRFGPLPNAGNAPPTTGTTTDSIEQQIKGAGGTINPILLQAQIEAHMKNLQHMSATSGVRSNASRSAQSHLAPALLLNKQGQLVDQSGKVVQEQTQHSKSLRINKGKAKTSLVNPYLSHLVDQEDTAPQSLPFDPRIKDTNKATKAEAAFKFVNEGKYVKMGDFLRAKDARKNYIAGAKRDGKRHFNKLLNDESGEAAAITDKLAKSNEDLLRIDRKDDDYKLPEISYNQDQLVPYIEWWDIPYLPKALRANFSSSNNNSSFNEGGVSYYDKLDVKNQKTYVYIQHPVPIAPSDPAAYGGKKAIPLFLTKKEQKRIRRQNRAEATREMQDKIALGLVEAPKPKVKIANMMRVLGDDAVHAPSAIEAQVNADITQRRMDHEMRNLAQKATPQERRERKMKKVAKDQAGAPITAIFRIGNLTTPAEVAAQHRFKIDVNAQENHLTGTTIVVNDPVLLYNDTSNQKTYGLFNLVIVEGGPRAIKRFMKLMLRRIDWKQSRYGAKANAESDDEMSDDDDKPKVQNNCFLVWKGPVLKKSFNHFKFEEFASIDTVKANMKNKNLGHFIDLALNFNPTNYDLSKILL